MMGRVIIWRFETLNSMNEKPNTFVAWKNTIIYHHSLHFIYCH